MTGPTRWVSRLTRTLVDGPRHRLRTRFALYGAGLAALLVLAMTLLSYAQTRELVLAGAHHEVAEAAERLLAPPQAALAMAREEVSAHARAGDAMVPEHRLALLEASLAAHHVPKQAVYRLGIAGPDGQLLAFGRDHRTTAPVPWIKDAIAAYATRTAIHPENNRIIWRVAAALGVPDGRPAAGALVLEIDLSQWLGSRDAPLHVDPGVTALVFSVDSQVIAQRGELPNPEQTSWVFQHALTGLPITDAGAALSVRVFADIQRFEQPLRDLMLRHLLIGLLGVGLVAAAAGLIARVLTHRIEHLESGVADIIAGKAVAPRLTHADFGDDEVGRLAHSVVTLLGRLKQHEQNLESLVAERTAALRRTEDELLRAQRVAQTGSWRLDFSGGRLAWSGETGRIFGCPTAPESYEAFLDHVHPADRESVEKAWTLAMAGLPFDIEHRILVDGAVRWVRQRAEFTAIGDDATLVALGTVQDITDRKTLLDQMQRLSVAVEQSPTSIVITDVRGHIEYVNPCFERTSGYRREELIGKKPGIVKSGRTLPFEYGALWATIQSGQVWRGEFENVRKTGEHFFEMASISPILDETGRITGFVGVKEDVTQRKAFERLIQEREAKLRALIDALPDILLVASPAGRIVEAHLPDAARYGIRPTDLLGTDYRNRLPANVIRTIRREFRELTAHSPRRTIDITVPIGSGPRDFSIGLSILTDDDGQPGGYIMLARDVSEQRAVEQSLIDSEAYNKALFDSSQIALVILQPETGEFIDCNAAALSLYGCPGRSDLLGKTLAEFSPATQYQGEDSTELARKHIAIALREGHQTFDWKYWHLDHQEWDAEITLMAFQHDGQVLLQCSLQNITERRRIEAQMRQALTVFNASSQAIMTTDRNGQITTVNPAFCRITGYTREEIIGQPATLLRHANPDAELDLTMSAQLDEQGSWEGETWNRRKSGDIYPQWLTVSALRDAWGEVTAYVSLFSDITTKKQQEEAIWRQANFDPLTGLANRHLLHDRLAHALTQARRHGTRVGLLFLDLDGFKWINDTLGHDVGDELLVEVGERLRSCVREQDTVARLGGDEFTLVVHDLADSESLRGVAEKAVSVLHDPFTLAGTLHHLSGSVGVTVFPDDGQDVQTLMKNADIAMYKSKQAGKNRFHFYAAHMQADAHARMQMETELRIALKEEQFVLHYQPVVDADSGELVGAEALLRWQHPEHGLVMPETFIPVAEESALIVPMGEWALREAARQWQAWIPLRGSGNTPIRLALNISGIQFRESGLATLLDEVIGQHGIDPRFLLLEITESVLIEGSDAVTARLAEIHSRGIHYALDDFGTGFSSLSYLKRFPVEVVKIDRSFIHDCTDDRSDAHLVEAIVNMAHSLDLKVAAEGVETEAQLRFLRDLGCDTVQGFLISRPVPAQSFTDMIQRGPLIPPAQSATREEARLLAALRTDRVDVDHWLERLLGEHSPDLAEYFRDQSWVHAGLDLRQAIDAHLIWRRRLNEYIFEQGETLALQDGDAAAHDRCTLGQWITRLDRADPQVQRLDRVHREFHQIAGAIVRDHHGGNRDHARRTLAGLRFRMASRDVVTAMITVFTEAANALPTPPETDWPPPRAELLDTPARPT